MILIAGAGAVMVFGMPYLLENRKLLLARISSKEFLNLIYGTVDPETKAEMEAARVDSPFAAMLGGKPSGAAANFDAAAWLAGAGKKGEGSGERGVSR